VTRVIVVGYGPVTAVQGGSVAGAFADALAREDLERLVDLVQTDSDDRDVLVLHPGWSAEPTLQRLQTIRSALADQRLAIYGSSLPPLAGSVLCSLAAALAPGAPSAGALCGVLPRLERQLVSVTWLSRLSHLRDPAPTVAQHAASLLPGTAFAVTSWPEPAIKQLKPKDAEVTIPTPQGAVGLVVAARDGDMDWVRQHVVRKVRDPRVLEVESSPLAKEWWGPGGVVECVLYPLDVWHLASRVSRHLSLRPCRWCAQPVATTPCPYCGLEIEVEQVA
jgi:hypothetical protein